jgi:hypothetical protein
MAYAHKLAELANQITNLTEAPMMAPDAGTGMFGYSRPQFEMKIRQLIQKMGFEKGINRMDILPSGKMMLYFANAAKARDFVITFNGMIRRLSKTAYVAQISTNFDTTKAAGSAALVTIDLNMLKAEETQPDLFAALESLHEAFINEGNSQTDALS